MICGHADGDYNYSKQSFIYSVLSAVPFGRMYAVRKRYQYVHICTSISSSLRQLFLIVRFRESTCACALLCRALGAMLSHVPESDRVHA